MIVNFLTIGLQPRGLHNQAIYLVEPIQRERYSYGETPHYPGAPTLYGAGRDAGTPLRSAAPGTASVRGTKKPRVAEATQGRIGAEASTIRPVGLGA